jgi:DNA-binding NarL/FixJ family response regulator
MGGIAAPAIAVGPVAGVGATGMWAPPSAGPRIVVIHEHPLVAAGLARQAERSLAAECVAGGSLRDALASIDSALPDLIVWSDGAEPGVSLPVVTARFRGAGAGAPVLVLARVHSADTVEDAVRAGASGYLPLDAAADRLATTVAAMLAGHAVLPDRQGLPRAPRLTAREAEVLRNFSRGLSCKQVAFELGMAQSTVKTHARSIFRKLDVCSRTAALHRAREMGML